jgi:hypothetical protein
MIATKTSKPKIESITVKHMYDDSPDTSWLGEYTDKWQSGAIKRVNAGRNEYKYFVPGMSHQEHWDALHKIGYSKGNCDELAREYNQRDLNHNEKLNGIEVKFSAKPSNTVIDRLKELGFRWSFANMVWYNRYSVELMSKVQAEFNTACLVS